MKKHPNQGGCWYCHCDDGEMLFSTEFDTCLHEACLKKRLREEPSDREAQIFAREFNVVLALGYPPVTPAPVVVEVENLEVESVDDDEQAMVAWVGQGTEPDIFFRFQSWDEQRRHERFKQFLGKKVRITMEVVE